VLTASLVGAMQEPERMETQAPQPALATELVLGAEPSHGAEAGAPDPDSHTMAPEPTTLSPLVARLPVELEVAVPVREFRVRNLLSLEKGNVIETQWAHADDLPLSAGEVQLAWSEFEVIESRLAVRVTRVA
jgi:flagellar motor switch/type III secretory pathway protein FliN